MYRKLPTLFPENGNRCTSQNVVLFFDYETMNIAQTISNPACNILPSEPFRSKAVVAYTNGDNVDRRMLDETAEVRSFRASVLHSLALLKSVPLTQGIDNV